MDSTVEKDPRCKAGDHDLDQEGRPGSGVSVLACQRLGCRFALVD